MKNKSLSILIVLVLLNIGTYAQSKSDKKILITYFSRSGNTEEVAKQIKDATGGDIFEVIPVTAYPTEYNACTEQAKKEINDNFKPALKSILDNFDSYDMIIVGSPIWWGTIAPPVATFLSSYNFEGKTILPFVTHGGSRLGRSADDIKKLCPTANVISGLPISGSNVKNAGDEIKKWLQENKVVK